MMELETVTIANIYPAWIGLRLLRHTGVEIVNHKVAIS